MPSIGPKFVAPLVSLLVACAALGACAPAGSSQTPLASGISHEPTKPVDLKRYSGRWFELARFETSFQEGCDGAEAVYTPLPDGTIRVVNTCWEGGPQGKKRSIEGVARVTPGSGDAKLAVSFFGPFEGEYWVLDHASDYDWSIVGESSGKYLWILSRRSKPSEAYYQGLVRRAKALGYDVSALRRSAR